MDEQRNRARLPLESLGEGRVPGTERAFSCRVRDFSVAGVQLLVTGGDVPASGEAVEVRFAVPRLDADDEHDERTEPLSLAGRVRHLEPSPEGWLCGVQMTGVAQPADGETLDLAYLEQYFDRYG